MFIKMLLSLPVWDCESELRMCNSLFHIWVNFLYYLNTITGSVDLRWSLGLAIQNATNLSLLLLPSAVGVASTNMGFFSECLFVVIEDKLTHLEGIFSWAFLQLSTCSVYFDSPLPELFWSVVKNPHFCHCSDKAQRAPTAVPWKAGGLVVKSFVKHKMCNICLWWIWR